MEQVVKKSGILKEQSVGTLHSSQLDYVLANLNC